MRTSGGTGGYVKPATGRQYILGGENAVVNVAQSAGVLRLYAEFIPYATPYTQLGFNVTGAGAAGSTLQPAVYDIDANGNPRNLIASGSLLDTSAAAVVSAGPAGTLPAGWVWVGGLCITAGAAPTVTSTSKSDHDPRGPFSPTDNAAGAAVLASQNGLAALPGVFAGTYVSGLAPVLFVTL